MIFRCAHHVGTLAKPKSYLNRLGNSNKYICCCFTRLIRLGHFVSDILGFGNAHTSVVAALTLRTFHVEHAQGFQAKMCLHIFPHRG